MLLSHVHQNRHKPTLIVQLEIISGKRYFIKKLKKKINFVPIALKKCFELLCFVYNIEHFWKVFQ